MRSYTCAVPVSEIESLTEKQRQVLDLVLRGMTSKQVAGELGISYKTVDAHVDAARTRLGVNSRAEAAQIYGIATYGESLPKALLRMPVGDGSGPHQSGAPEGEVAEDSAVFVPPKSHFPRRRVPWLDSSKLGVVGVLALIIAGAIGMALVVAGVLGIASGLTDLLAGFSDRLTADP